MYVAYVMTKYTSYIQQHKKWLVLKREFSFICLSIKTDFHFFNTAKKYTKVNKLDNSKRKYT